MLHDLRVGFRELVIRPWLLMIMGASGISLMAILGTLFVLGPAVASRSLGGADAWGLVVGAFGLGSVAGGVVALKVPARRQLRAIFAVALLTVPGILLLAVPAPIAVLALAEVAAGIAMSYAGTVYEVVLQQWIPPAVLARVASYDWLVTTVLSSVGLVLAGSLAEAFGVRQTLIGAAVVVTIAAAVPLASRSVRQGRCRARAFRARVDGRAGARRRPSRPARHGRARPGAARSASGVRSSGLNHPIEKARSAPWVCRSEPGSDASLGVNPRGRAWRSRSEPKTCRRRSGRPGR